MKNKGFTLIEILVVATIIALLAVAAAVSYTSLNRSSRDGRRKADLEQIRAAIEQWRSDKGAYPTSIGATVQLAVDCGPPDHTLIDTTITPQSVYLQKVPKDPQCTARTYYYNRLSDSDYTLAAGLEMGTTICQAAPACGTGIDCTYCVGPYGQK